MKVSISIECEDQDLKNFLKEMLGEISWFFRESSSK